MPEKLDSITVLDWASFVRIVQAEIEARRRLALGPDPELDLMLAKIIVKPVRQTNA
jgi:hypothetical protein